MIEPKTERAPSFELGALIEGLTYEQYAAEPGLRASHLRHLRKSPAHFQAELRSPKQETEAMRFGKLFHSALENGERFRDLLRVEPVFTGYTQKGEESTRSKEAKIKREAWRAELPAGSIIMTREEADAMVGMLNSLSSYGKLKERLTGGVRETSAWVRDPETELILKFRPDLISANGFLVDFKTARDASEQVFTNEIFSQRQQFYILGCAHYVHCAKLSGICRHDNMSLIAIEKVDPWGINIFWLNQGQLDVGERIRRRLTRLYADCLASGKWPSYEQRIISPAIPAYVAYEDDEEFSEN